MNKIWTGSRIADSVEAVLEEAETTVDQAARLRRHGLSVTAQRLAVLRAVNAHPHSTADDIDKAVRMSLGAVSRQAVYDALGVLTEKGLLRRIEPARSPARY